MGTYYFDTSAIIKRYFDEPGSAWIRELCSDRDAKTGALVHDLMLGGIARVEVFSAVARRTKGKEISEKEADTAYKAFVTHIEAEYELIAITPDLLISAAHLARQHTLRAYDAVQLALAIHANDLLKQERLTLTFITADKTLVQAARDEGLAVENPNEH
jgi:predicted nucleic acid-binding protein